MKSQNSEMPDGGCRTEASRPESNGYTIGPLDAGPPCCVRNPLIEVDDLVVHYGNARVLDGISLTINRGCVTALIGPSGCGKTSFLSSLNRMTDMIPGCRMKGGHYDRRARRSRDQGRDLAPPSRRDDLSRTESISTVDPQESRNAA